MVKRAPARRRPRKAKPGTKGLGPAECRLEQPTGAAAEAAEAITKAGGCVVGSYKEPLACHPVLLCVLPIDAVEPTPFQRDLSDAQRLYSSSGWTVFGGRSRSQRWCARGRARRNRDERLATRYRERVCRQRWIRWRWFQCRPGSS